MPTLPPVNLSGSSQQLTTGQTTYSGFTVRETTKATDAIVVLWDTDTNGPNGLILDEIALTAGQSARELYPRDIPVSKGIYAQVTGSVAGSIRRG